MNPYLKAAQLERERLTKQKVDIDKRIAELDTFLRVAHTLPEVVFARGKVSVTRQPKKRVYKKGATTKGMLLGLAEQLLSDGRWMLTKDILSEALDRGIEIGGKHKFQQVSQILSREKDRFKTEPRKGWALKNDRPKVEAKDARTPLASGVRVSLPH